MRAYTVPLKFSQFEGLAKYSDVAPNSAAFESAINFTLGPNGIVEPTALSALSGYIASDTPPYASGLPETYAYPYPRLFVGSEVLLFVYETSIYEWYFSGDDYLWKEIVPVDSSTGLDFAIPPGGGWDFADIGGSWFLFKPPGDLGEGEVGCTLFKTGLAALLGNEAQVLGQSKISITTGCAYRGRLILGGFSTQAAKQPYTETAPDDYSDVFTNYYERSAGVPWTSITNLQALAGWLKPNTVWWSTIGGGDILAFFYPDIALKGIPWGEDPERDLATVADPRRSLLFDHLMRNECGWINMPSKGAVLQLLPFDSDVAVYSEDSISLLQDTAGKMATIPPTFGLRKVCGFGIAAKNTVGGDASEHVFVSRSKDLWKWKAGARPEWIGYRGIFELFAQDMTILVNESPGTREYYFSALRGVGLPPDTYLLSGDKLTQITATRGVTGIINQGGLVMAIYDPTAADASPANHLLYGKVDFAVVPLDFGNRGKKVINQIELDADLPASCTVTVSIQNKDVITGVYGTAVTCTLDSNGFARIRQVGVDFKIAVNIVTTGTGDTPYEYLRIRSLKLTYQQLDKRYKSGIEVGGVGNVS